MVQEVPHTWTGTDCREILCCQYPQLRAFLLHLHEELLNVIELIAIILGGLKGEDGDGK